MLLDCAGRAGAPDILLFDTSGRYRDVKMIPHSLLPQPAEIPAAVFIASDEGSSRTPQVSYGFLKHHFEPVFCSSGGPLVTSVTAWKANF